jgi:cytoskeletal protein CcmA (bactofilin family)
VRSSKKSRFDPSLSGLVRSLADARHRDQIAQRVYRWLIISRNAQITGAIAAERVVVNGRVEGPIQGGDVVLKSQAHVAGDIQHQTLTIERGAYFEGRSVRVDVPNGRQLKRVDAKPPREIAQKDREP